MITSALKYLLPTYEIQMLRSSCEAQLWGRAALREAQVSASHLRVQNKVFRNCFS